MREDVVDVMTVNGYNDKELIQPFMRHTYNVNVMLSIPLIPQFPTSNFQLPIQIRIPSTHLFPHVTNVTHQHSTGCSRPPSRTSYRWLRPVRTAECAWWRGGLPVGGWCEVDVRCVGEMEGSPDGFWFA